MLHQEFRKEFKNNIVENQRINLGLSINSVGFKSIIQTNDENRPESIEDYKLQFKKGVLRNEFKLIYITKGNGIICFDNCHSVEISEGKILLIYPQQAYDYYHKTKEWKEYYIRFEADKYYSQLIKDKFCENNIVIDFGYNEEIITLFNRAMEVVGVGLNTYQAYLSGLLFHVLGLIIAVSSDYTQKDINFQKIQQAKIIMNESIFENISIPEIAYRLNISYSLFRQLFKKYAAVSPAKYFNMLKLKKAKQLLVETSFSVKEIAFMLSNENPDNFYTIFKKNTGETPSKYRLKARNTLVENSQAHLKIEFDN
jgi:AraC-like DNA-binding protein